MSLAISVGRTTYMVINKGNYTVEAFEPLCFNSLDYLKAMLICKALISTVNTFIIHLLFHKVTVTEIKGCRNKTDLT